MGFFDNLANAVGSSAEQISYALSKNGGGESLLKVLTFDAADVSNWAAYNRVASAAKDVISRMGNEEQAQVVRDLIKGGQDFRTPEFIETLSKMTGDGSDEATQTLGKKISSMQNEFFNNTATISRDAPVQEQVAAYAKFLSDGKRERLNGFEAISGYFGDKKYGGTRLKALGVAAVGTGVASRYLSGGNLTTTNTGERDIAGIPFI